VASITFTKIWKIYNKKVIAVRDLNLVAEDHEFLALLGPSGCGKTTSLRMVAGLEDITAGEIKIGDKVVNDLRPRERDIAMVYESYGLYPHLTVNDNIAFPLRVRDIPDADIKRRVARASEIVDLQGIMDRFPSELGDGQKQRVSIARAIVREPAVFLFDEPISHLDETLRRRMRSEIKHLQGTLGTTMIYVTHDQIEAMAMADRIVVMDLGVVQQLGTPNELFDNPANLFCAGFIGEPPMNIVSGKLVREAGRLLFQSNGLKLPVTNPAQVQALDALGKPEVILGVRPTHVVPKVTPSATSIPAEVYNFEPHGDYNIVTSKVGAEILLAVSGSDFFPDFGQAIHLEFGSNLHFFDVDTKWNVLKGQGANHG
jgi:multiple sugar transport system ATP-binding protein